MNLRLKTSVSTETKLNELQTMLQVSSKAAVMRLAIGISLKIDGDPRIIDGAIIKYDVHNQAGADYNRFTIFGDDELMYKILMKQHLNNNIPDDVFFPWLTNAHIDRGIKELYADYKLTNNKIKYIQKIIEG